ncbi:MAG TPA: hypothetical protein VK805_12955 [Candidatus Baltobacteraceae bacterium]|nr:hypothetical protein [Candidatus Baltobacteraceae bacterium]
MKIMGLRFPNGSTSTIRIRNVLGLIVAGFHALHYFAHARHGDRYSSEEPRSEPAVLRVSDKRLALLRLIAGAESVEGEKSFIMIHGLAREFVKAEKEPPREAIVVSNL